MYHHGLALTFLEVLDIAAREGNPNLVDFGGGDGRARSVVFLFTLSDVTHPGSSGESDGDYEDMCSEKPSQDSRNTYLRAVVVIVDNRKLKFKRFPVFRKTPRGHVVKRLRQGPEYCLACAFTTTAIIPNPDTYVTCRVCTNRVTISSLF